MDRYPWLPTSVYKAFDLAKRLCFDATDDDNALQVVLPWLFTGSRETRDLMGKDYWPCGVRSNKFALEAMVRYAHEQGLTAKPVPIEKLFIPGCRRALQGLSPQTFVQGSMKPHADRLAWARLSPSGSGRSGRNEAPSRFDMDQSRRWMRADRFWLSMNSSIAFVTTSDFSRLV